MMVTSLLWVEGMIREQMANSNWQLAKTKKNCAAPAILLALHFLCLPTLPRLELRSS
jgi:hypothetical protein